MSVNGSEADAVVDAVLDPSVAIEGGRPVVVPVQDDDTQLLIAKRDRALSRIAIVLIDSAKMLDPILRIVTAKLLALMALLAATGLCAYTLTILREPGGTWERVATCGLFIMLAAWLISKGQR